MGAELATIVRANLAAFPPVTIHQADFDTLTLPPATYNLALSATAFHWLDPLTRFQRTHDLLKNGGTLALFRHRPVRTDLTRDHIEALQSIYQRHAPALTRDYERPPHPDALTTEYAQLIPASGCFADLNIRKHYVATTYSAETYLDLLGTFSDHRALPPTTRRQLFAAIKRLLDSDFAGTIVRETVALLYLARRH